MHLGLAVAVGANHLVLGLYTLSFLILSLTFKLSILSQFKQAGNERVASSVVRKQSEHLHQLAESGCRFALQQHWPNPEESLRLQHLLQLRLKALRKRVLKVQVYSEQTSPGFAPTCAGGSPLTLCDNNSPQFSCWTTFLISRFPLLYRIKNLLARHCPGPWVPGNLWRFHALFFPIRERRILRAPRLVPPILSF